MTFAIGNLKIFHDLIEIHEYLSNLPPIYLYQYQGMLITVNSIPILRIFILHDIVGNSLLTYTKISRKQVETFYS